MMIKDLEILEDLTSNQCSAVLGGNSTIASGGCVREEPYLPRLPFPIDPKSPGSSPSIPGLEPVPPVYRGSLPSQPIPFGGPGPADEFV
jgi:hypothetical protein